MNLGENIKKGSASWSFEDIPLDKFETHIERSIPCYKLTHDLGLWTSDFFCSQNSRVYDIGSSSGKFLGNLHKRHLEKNLELIGIEPVEEMCKDSQRKYNQINFINSDIRDISLEKSSFITSYYTMQFIPTACRQDIISKIYESLEWGSSFLMFEKVRAPDARFQDYMTQIYTEYKVKQNYTAENILSKAQSLKGVLEPFSHKGNMDLLKRAGFKDVMSIYKFICFEGFLAIK
ncbi:methyltransferase domain-containing protein [Prochlorococcus sp. MIT 1223]|uniref:methyltransferase domain-containing protein n=1 Tax=Prochlorococcus sp. MIT 1223 TaxID=3096217 RepID=UPI002A7640C4|nr:methyltransferase domain-containing protein [Prochlorococcus sp. MIT 1223]